MFFSRFFKTNYTFLLYKNARKKRKIKLPVLVDKDTNPNPLHHCTEIILMNIVYFKQKKINVLQLLFKNCLKKSQNQK